MTDFPTSPVSDAEKLRLLCESGYDANKTHPECYRGFSYVKFFELCGGLAQTPDLEAIVSRIMRIRNGMILDGDAEALIRKEIVGLMGQTPARTQRIIEVLNRVDYRNQTLQRLAEAIAEVDGLPQESKQSFRDEVAAMLLARDEAEYHLEQPIPDSLIVWGRHCIATGKDAKHSGDCTNESHSCARCITDLVLAQADQIIAALSDTRPDRESGK